MRDDSVIVPDSSKKKDFLWLCRMELNYKNPNYTCLGLKTF